MVRPTGIELVSSAPQADTLSIELWAQNRIFLQRNNDYLIIVTFFRRLCKLFFIKTHLSSGGKCNLNIITFFMRSGNGVLFRCGRGNWYNKTMKENNTGTYVYDKKLQKMVKISSCIPSLGKAKHACGGCCGCCHHED